MNNEIMAFGDDEVKKGNLTAIKTNFFKKDVDIDNILISNKISSGNKSYK